MTLAIAVERFADLAEWISQACYAQETLAMSRASTTWRATFSHPCCWSLYLLGPSRSLVQPILIDPVVREVFTGPSVHRANFRAVVAALCTPGWQRCYPRMRRRLAAGWLRRPLMDLWQKQKQRRMKAALLKDLRKAKEKQMQIAKQSPLETRMHRALLIALPTRREGPERICFQHRSEDVPFSTREMAERNKASSKPPSWPSTPPSGAAQPLRALLWTPQSSANAPLNDPAQPLPVTPRKRRPTRASPPPPCSRFDFHKALRQDVAPEHLSSACATDSSSDSSSSSTSVEELPLRSATPVCGNPQKKTLGPQHCKARTSLASQLVQGNGRQVLGLSLHQHARRSFRPQFMQSSQLLFRAQSRAV